MFIYLSKKIAIPNGLKLKCVSWNSEQGWIACGGESGLLKVLKLEGGATGKTEPGAAAPSNLSMNQTLEGHNGAVRVVTWNENYRKLSTSDQNGLIIVWMLHKGMWFEEMINNRNKSVVRDMKWTQDGQKICIVYEDGAVIVGSVDGNRLWGKELKVQLCHVAWSPDSRNIVFCTLNGEVHIYDALGSYMLNLPLFAGEGEEPVSIAGVDWGGYNSDSLDATLPSLALAFENGRVQLLRHENDEKPVLIDTGMRVTNIKWNNTGEPVLAIGGVPRARQQSSEQREYSMVQFYNPLGLHLRSLRVPGSSISGLSWEGGGLRIALAVDSFIYFANIRPDYHWGFFGNTLVYSYKKPDRKEHCVVFWDTKSDDRYTKYVKKLLAIRACGENCVLATKTDESSGQYILILCNAIGSPVDSKYIGIEPQFVTMSKQHIVVASEDTVYVWQYRTQVSKLTSMDQQLEADKMLGRKDSRERVFHIDEFPSASTATGFDKYVPSASPTSDAVCSVAASDTCLVVGRESGTVNRYTLPHISLENKHVLRCRPQLLALNCDSTRMSIIDINGVLTFFDFEPKAPNSISLSKSVGEHLSFERKDVWDMMWSDDNPELFAMMEKTRMYIFRGLNPEEPVTSSGYICHFSDLQIQAVQLDAVMLNPEACDKEVIIQFETKSLRDTRDILSKVGMDDVVSFIEDNPHPRLWRILAEAALEKLDCNVADKAFVHCSDYQGIQFVKRLRKLDDRLKQQAEVAAYFKRFDEAERIYREMDRMDLAIELRMQLGDWFRVVQLVQSGGGDDTMLTTAWSKIGDYYADRQRWAKASQYYGQSKELKQMVNAFYFLEDFHGIERVMHMLPDGNELLITIAEQFASVGLSEQAISAYLKAGDIKGAIDCCVLLNQWDRAVELAEQHNFSQIEGLLSKYASHLLATQKPMQAIELYRKAGRHIESANLLSDLAKEAAASKVNPMRAKKLYVLAALEVERYRKKTLEVTVPMEGGGGHMTAQTAQTLSGLLEHDNASINNKVLDNAWRGAEAMHFFLLAQRQMYDHQIDAAMRTAIRCKDFEDVLDPVDLHSLIALIACHNKFYNICSQAFIKLETQDSAEKCEAYANLALQIFTKHAPQDPSSVNYECFSCGYQLLKDWNSECPECGIAIPVCVATGRAILDSRYYQCRVCKHRAYEHELRSCHHCPLCHSALT
jgi:WD repeat-containing protein 35